jgi:hypothetical protein
MLKYIVLHFNRLARKIYKYVLVLVPVPYDANKIITLLLYSGAVPVQVKVPESLTVRIPDSSLLLYHVYATGPLVL